jgi:serine/threonine protein kinase
MRGSEECQIELEEGLQLTDILKTACKQFGCKENYKIARLYNKSGIQLFKDDIILLAGGDILYLAAKGTLINFYKHMCRRVGEDFNFSAILDDYQIIKELGQGGFGKVVLGKHKEDRKEVAIKFMDVSENRK